MEVKILLVSGVHPRYVAHCSNDANYLVVTSNPDKAMPYSPDAAQYLLGLIKPMWPLAQISRAFAEEC